MVNNGFRVNEFSERLYGCYHDDSAQLGKSIKNLYYHMIDTKEHVCPECGRIYEDVFFPTKVYNPICIECAAELNYNIHGKKVLPIRSYNDCSFKTFVRPAKVPPLNSKTLVTFLHAENTRRGEHWLRCQRIETSRKNLRPKLT